MNFVEHKTQVHTIRDDDPNFMIADGMTIWPRAMLHILPACPDSVRKSIAWAIDNGYLKVSANITERELIFMGLSK